MARLNMTWINFARLASKFIRPLPPSITYLPYLTTLYNRADSRQPCDNSLGTKPGVTL